MDLAVIASIAGVVMSSTYSDEMPEISGCLIHTSSFACSIRQGCEAAPYHPVARQSSWYSVSSIVMLLSLNHNILQSTLSLSTSLTELKNLLMSEDAIAGFCLVPVLKARKLYLGFPWTR